MDDESGAGERKKNEGGGAMRTWMTNVGQEKWTRMKEEEL